jgi:hypothetical protein
MGALKDRMMHEEALGCSLGTDKVICTDCIEDEALAEVVRQHPEHEPCSFCGKRKKHRGSMSAVIERVAEAIRLDWNQPEDELYYDRESETGWGGTVYDASEVMADIGYETSNWDVVQEIIDAFADRQFCQRDYGTLTPIERQRAGWEGFQHAIKHVRRFTFWSMTDDGNDPNHPDYLPAGAMLGEIGKMVRKAKLRKVYPKGTAVWRVRLHDAGRKYREDHELSPPPIELAIQANRMSPAGVSMFYGAEDYKTACAETIDVTKDAGRQVSGGKFKAKRKLLLLDLVDLPDPPSYFDIDRRDLYHAVVFLRRFARDLAIPITRDGREHIEYAPTQAFTEFVRFEMKADTKKGFAGIRYRSSRNGRPCVVLFCGQAECVDDPDAYGVDRWLALDKKSVRTDTVKSLRLPTASATSSS